MLGQPADDVFVQVFAGTQAEKEAALEQRSCRRRRLSDNGRVDADERTGDARADLERVGPLRDRSEH